MLPHKPFIEDFCFMTISDFVFFFKLHNFCLHLNPQSYKGLQCDSIAIHLNILAAVL